MIKNRIVLMYNGVIKLLIFKRAYKGYLEWCKRDEPVEPVSFTTFKSFEDFKIVLAFRQYFVYVKGYSYRYVCKVITFRSVFLDRI